jgi:hypothetical protein
MISPGHGDEAKQKQLFGIWEPLRQNPVPIPLSYVAVHERFPDTGSGRVEYDQTGPLPDC